MIIYYYPVILLVYLVLCKEAYIQDIVILFLLSLYIYIYREREEIKLQYPEYMFLLGKRGLIYIYIYI